MLQVSFTIIPRETTPRFAARARFALTPMSLLTISQDIRGGVATRTPLLLLALGHYQGNRDTNEIAVPYCRYQALSKLATLIIRDKYALPAGTPEELRRAIRYGEIGAAHALLPLCPITPAAVLGARHDIDQLLAQSPITAAQLETYRDKILGIIMSASDQQIPREEFIENTAFNPAQFVEPAYPRAKMIYFVARCNILFADRIYTIVAGGDWAVWFNNMKDYGHNNYLPIPQAARPNPVPDIPAAWAGATAAIRMACYESLGYIDDNIRRKDCVGASVCYLVNMVKSDTMTDAWARKLSDRLSNAIMTIIKET